MSPNVCNDDPLTLRNDILSSGSSLLDGSLSISNRSIAAITRAGHKS